MVYFTLSGILRYRGEGSIIILIPYVLMAKFKPDPNESGSAAGLTHDL